jgi:chromate transporter
MQSGFYGVGACVIGIITHSAYKLTHRSLGKEKLLWVIYLASAIATILTETEDLRLFLLAGIATWFTKAPPAFLHRGQLAWLGLFSVGEAKTLGQIFLFFTKAGAFVFGSGLAIVPFLYGGVVKEYGWLSETQFVDAVAVAMITPGPVVITVGFIGYLVAGFPGAVVASGSTFLPCYLFTILPAPYFKKYGKRPDLAAFVEGITTAAIGAISGSVVVLAQRAIHDIPTALIAVIAGTILWNTKRIPEPILVLGGAIIGLLLKGV